MRIRFLVAGKSRVHKRNYCHSWFVKQKNKYPKQRCGTDGSGKDAACAPHWKVPPNHGANMEAETKVNFVRLWSAKSVATTRSCSLFSCEPVEGARMQGFPRLAASFGYPGMMRAVIATLEAKRRTLSCEAETATKSKQSPAWEQVKIEPSQYQERRCPFEVFRLMTFRGWWLTWGVLADDVRRLGFLADDAQGLWLMFRVLADDA